jgi:hypothetical protein
MIGFELYTLAGKVRVSIEPDREDGSGALVYEGDERAVHMVHDWLKVQPGPRGIIPYSRMSEAELVYIMGSAGAARFAPKRSGRESAPGR